MKTRFIGRFIAAGFFSALLLSGCARRDEATVGTPANPLVLVFSPAHAPVASPKALDIIKKHIEKVTGMTVVLNVAKTQGETVNSFKAGEADAGLVTLEEFLVAREEYGVHAELQALRGYRLTEYEGTILTKSAGGAGSVAELNGKKVGFIGPYSVSGFTLPAIYLEKAGVKAVSVFSTGHAENLKKLVDGEVFAAATYARQASRFPGIKVLAFTGKVPNEPVIVRRGLSPEKRKALAAAFLTMGSTAEVQRILASVADITGFRPADEALYRPLHDLILNEKRSVYDLVPHGWEIYRLNQPYYPD